MYKIHLNYSLTDVNDRILNVEDELGKIDGELVEYFDARYDPNLGTTNQASMGRPLSHEDRVCKKLEQMADFILYSPDIRKQTREGIKANKSRKETYIAKGRSLRSDDSCQNSRDLLTMINIGVSNVRVSEKHFKPMPNIAYSANSTKDRNYKLKIEQKIYAKDIASNPVIADYQNEMDRLLSRLHGQKNTYYVRKKIRKTLSTMRDDQVRVKDSMNGTIYAKAPLPDTRLIDWWLFDFTNKEHVKALLRFSIKNYDFSNYIHCLVYDLNQLIKKGEFDRLRLNIIRKYREDKNLTPIGNEIGLRRQSVWWNIQMIVSRIIKQYKSDREDWLCLRYVRGQYKQCRGKCKEIKLVSHFAKNKVEKDGYARVCRKCEKERRSK